MGVASTAAMEQLADDSISILACSISSYICTNFGALSKSAQPTSLSALATTIRGFVALRSDAIL